MSMKVHSSFPRTLVELDRFVEKVPIVGCVAAGCILVYKRALDKKPIRDIHSDRYRTYQKYSKPYWRVLLVCTPIGFVATIAIDAYAKKKFKKCYEEGIKHSLGPTQDLKASHNHFKKALDYGHQGAIVPLALCYLRGHGVEQDHQMALSLLVRGKYNEDQAAIAYLGQCHEYGYGTPINLETAKTCYEHAAKNGNNLAAYFLQKLYRKEIKEIEAGGGLPSSEITAKKEEIQRLFQQFMQTFEGDQATIDPEAHYLLAKHYQEEVEDEGENSYQEIYRKLASQGHIPSIVEHGKCLYQEEKLIEAKEEWTKAAEQGDLHAHFHLGIYQYDMQELDAAIVHFKKYLWKNCDSQVNYYLGLCYFKKENYKLSSRHFAKASDKGCPFSTYFRALFFINPRFASAANKTINYEQAKTLLLLAIEGTSEGKCFLACAPLGKLHLENKIQGASLAKALEYFTLGDEKEDNEATFSLAKFFQEDRGIYRKDLSTTIRLLQKAADRGHADSHIALGDIFSDEQNEVFNRGLAIEHYIQAKELGGNVDLVKLARLFLQVNEPTESQKILDKLIEKNPKHHEAYLQRAILLNKEEDYLKAVSLKNREAMARCGAYYYEKYHKETDQSLKIQWLNLAKEQLEKAVEITDDFPLDPRHQTATGSAFTLLGMIHYDPENESDETESVDEVVIAKQIAARSYYEEGAALENAQATFNFAVCLIRGVGGSLDTERGFLLVSKAKEMGVTKAEHFFRRADVRGMQQFASPRLVKQQSRLALLPNAEGRSLALT